MKKIYVFGSLIMDNVIRSDKIPSPGEAIIGNSFNIYFGGKGVNQAVACKKLGGNCQMIGAVGDDKNGELFISLLEDYKFDTSYIFKKDGPNGLSSIWVEENSGQNRIMVILGANNKLSASDIASLENRIEPDSIFLAQQEIPQETLLEVSKLAKRKHATFILNPAPFRPIWDEILSTVDYLTPNEGELLNLVGLKEYNDEEVDKALAILVDKGVKNIIVTLGDKGSLFYNKHTKIYSAPYKVKAIDTVGAGDAFNGGFAYALSEGLSIEKCLEIANATGALAVTKNGAIPSLPTREEIDEFLYKIHFA